MATPEFKPHFRSLHFALVILPYINHLEKYSIYFSRHCMHSFLHKHFLI